MVHKTHPGSKMNLDKAEQLFHLLFENHPIPIFVFDLKTLAFLEINKAMVEKHGYSREEFQELTLKNILPAQDAARLLEIVEKKQHGLHYSGEWRHQCKDGRVIGVEITSHTLEFDGHQAALVIAQDITALKQMENIKNNLTALIENTQDSIWAIDSNYRLIVSNINFIKGVEAELGYRIAQGESVLSNNLPQGMRTEWLGYYDRALRGESFSVEVSLQVDLNSINMEFQFHPIRSADGIISGVVGSGRNITARKLAEEALARRAQELEAVAEVSTAASSNLEQGQLLQSVADLSKERFNLYHAHVYLVNEAGDTLVLAAGAGEVGRQMALQGRQISLYQIHSLVARAARELKGVIVNDVQQEQDFLAHPFLPDTRAELAVPIIAGDKLIGILDVQANYINRFTEEDVLTMSTLAAQIAVAVQNARLFTERKQVEDELRRAKEALEVVNMELRYAVEHEQLMARTDMLTGLNNRRNLFELAEHEFEVAKRYQQPLSIIVFDIDYFKQINDTYGHAVGDKMLEHVAQVSRAQLRDVDIIGRYGGEEFVIVLPVTSAPKACLLAQRILEHVAAIRLHTDRGPATVTLSIGIAEIIHSEHDKSVDILIRRADEAMYAAKRAGRNRAMIFDPDGTGEI